MSPDDKREIRSKLLTAVAELSLPLSCRPLDAFHPIEDTLLFVESELKTALVVVVEDVEWGPEFDSFMEPADGFRPLPNLCIHVPNTVEGRIPEILQALKAWFTT